MDRDLGPVLEFMRLLWSVDHGLQSTSKRMATEVGVTGPQRLVIRIVGRFPSISAGGLASVLRLHPSTLTGVLRRLEQRGMLERRADPQDSRRALFRLTARGEEANAVRTGTVEAGVRRALARSTPAELEVARNVLQRLAEEVGKEPEVPAATRVTGRAPARPRPES